MREGSIGGSPEGRFTEGEPEEQMGFSPMKNKRIVFKHAAAFAENESPKSIHRRSQKEAGTQANSPTTIDRTSGTQTTASMPKASTTRKVRNVDPVHSAALQQAAKGGLLQNPILKSRMFGRSGS
eukprot:CAMPEP_0170487730 /NCGR_PEP_ID=MMETSP0208-20121228/6472_1 /TAXON_ID=197538 /ORGANISM="Strombidium inclinatum, Strain S3" /LENGTH=124 /DNA_ID=CAMNT_0010762103 /DNA_START=409 /DNA_END=783 /DNA_ORIENTATION=+